MYWSRLENKVELDTHTLRGDLTLPNKHYSGHNKTQEEKVINEQLRKRFEESIVGMALRIHIQQENNGCGNI